MSIRPFAEQERGLLEELASLFALRSEQERAIPARLRDGLAGAERRHRESTEGARQAFEASVGAAAAEQVAARKQAEAEFGARLDAVKRARDTELSAFQERTRTMGDAIAARLDEGKWLAETMLESGETRARAAYEAARKAIGQWVEGFDAVERSVQVALTERRHAPMPTSRASDPGAGDGSPGAQANDLEEAAKAVGAESKAVERTMHPRILEPMSVLGVLLLGVVAGAEIGGWVGGEPVWANPAAAGPRTLLGAGVGAGLGLVVLMAFRFVSRRRVPSAACGLHEALCAGRDTAARALLVAGAARDAEIAGLKSQANSEWVEVQASAGSLAAEVAQRNKEKQPQLRARHEGRLEQVRAERERALGEIDRGLADRRAGREAELAAATRDEDDVVARSRRALEEADRRDWAALERTWRERITRALTQVDALAGVGREISRPWDPGAWERIPAVTEPPAGVRFGALRLDLGALPGGLSPEERLGVPGSTVRELPLMVELLGKGSVLLRAAPEQRGVALDALNNIMLRLLTGLPPGKARFTIVDPVGLGQSFAGLMHLSDYEEALIGERIWTDPKHIEQRLTDLTEHMETVIQKYLRNEYETIQAYNAEAGEVAEPYRFLVVADLPSAMTDGAAKRLASIATSGARCGVFLLMMTTQAASRGADGQKKGTGQSTAQGFPWAEIERHSMVLQVNASGVRWCEEPFSPWPVELEPPPEQAAAVRLVHRIGEHAKDSTRVQVPFTIVEPAEDKVWSGDAAALVRLPLGRAGAKKLQYMTLGQGTAQHALIAGRTGSGKSTLLHVIITTAAMWYSPDEVELYLVDFKKGVEFKTYATHRLPHARVIAVESEREFGLSVLRRLDAELTRRGTLFRDAGVQELAAYRARGIEVRAARTSMAPEPLPRILLVVDEFQEFFVEDDRLAQDAGLLLDRLVRQGRAFGMHVILGSQTLAGAYSLARSTLGQMAVRIALQCSESDSYLILSEDNPAPRLLSRPGEAIYNDTSGLIEGNSPFQIVWLPDEVREVRLQAIAARFAATGRPPPPQIAFEGNVPGDLANNRLLADLLSRPEGRRPAPILWLGEPLAIKEPTGITLRRQSAANALIVGHQEEHAAAMTAGAIVSLAAWLRAGGVGCAMEAGQVAPPITILDATPPDVPHADLLPRLCEGLSGMARWHRSPRRADFDGTLGLVAAEIERRNASGRADHPPAVLVVHGLHRFRELRKSDEFSYSGDGEQASSPARVFAGILRAGPSVGVHAIVWCDTATNVDRMLERSALREFASRVLMQMSAGDSTQLIEGPQASALGFNRALLYSEDTGVMEKFRLYSAPTAEWMAATLQRIAAPVGA